MQQYHVSPPVVTQRLLDYAHLRYTLIFVREAVVWLSLWIVLQLGWSARIRDLFQRTRAGAGLAALGPPLRAALAIVGYVAVLNVVLALLRLPFNLYSGYYVEQQFGLTHQSMVSFLGDLTKERLVDIIGDSIGFLVAFAVIERFPRKWPVMLWAALTPIIAFAIFVYPLVVDPLFNKYTPMADSSEKQAIETLAAHAGLPDAPVFVVDKSRQTTKLNAEVTGLGPSARVVIWDTTIGRLPQPELLAVVGHELGHYALGHIIFGFLLAIGGLFLGLQAAARFKDKFVSLLPKRWGIQSITDPAAIAALLLAGSILGFFLEPLDNAVSREIEHQADAYGLQITHDPAAMASAFVALSQDNLADPDPPAFIQFWFFNHPSLRERIDFALGIKG